MIHNKKKDLAKVNEKNSPVQLTKLYIFALSIVAFLSIASQVIIQNALNIQRADSFIINMAGRQRMLSQKILKHCLDLERKFLTNTKDTLARKELNASMELWIQFHDGLYHRNPQIGLGGENSEAVNTLFAQIDPYYQKIVMHIRVFTNLFDTSDEINLIDQQINSILHNEAYFLTGMDNIVRQYETEARARVIFIKRIEMILLFSVLSILLLEGLFIFRPAAGKIKSTLESLQLAKEKLSIANKDLEEKISLRTKEIQEKNAELEKNNIKLKEINNDLDNFVYTASHDLKGPINNIEGLVNVLESDIPEVQSKSKGLLTMIYQAIERLKITLADLSDTGKAKYEILGKKDLIRFEEICSEVLLSMDQTVKETDARISTDFFEAPEIRFPRKSMRSIIYNLISNALKFKSPDRIPRIKLSTKESGDFIVLEVEDNGLGVKESDHKKVFSMYERIHEHVEGTGVGMPMVKKILENSGGKIEIKSTEGIGTTFYLFFKK